jgi:hypothetical protein
VQARYNPEVINTIRLMVFDTDTGPRVVGGLMRLANQSTVVDNFMQGGVAVPIDLERGTLGAVGYLKKDFKPVRVHARSGLPLAGQPVPMLSEASALVCRLQRSIALKAVGWDVALLKTGPCIIEANRTWDVLLSVYTIPGFLERFLDYHLERAEIAARFELDGNFSDRIAARQWLGFLAGLSRVSGRVDVFSPNRVIFTIAGSKRGMDEVAERLKRESASFHVPKIHAYRTAVAVKRGFDLSATFDARAATLAAAAV